MDLFANVTRGKDGELDARARQFVWTNNSDQYYTKLTNNFKKIGYKQTIMPESWKYGDFEFGVRFESTGERDKGKFNWTTKLRLAAPKVHDAFGLFLSAGLTCGTDKRLVAVVNPVFKSSCGKNLLWLNF